MEIKLLRDLSRTTIRTPVNDSAKSGIVIVRILHRSWLQVCSPRKKTHFYKKDSFKLDWSMLKTTWRSRHTVVRTGTTSFGQMRQHSGSRAETLLMFGESRKRCTTQRPNSGGSIMLWECFSASAAENLVNMEEIMKNDGFVKILKETLKKAKLSLVLRFVIQHASRQKPKVNVTDWPAQSLDLNWSVYSKK